MNHGLTREDVLAFTGDRKYIWHGIGQRIRTGQRATTVFRQVGLDWDTELVPVYAEIGTGKKKTKIELDDHRAHIRRDNNALLGLVSNGYKPIDNGDLAKFADQLVKGLDGAEVSTAGSLLGGKRVFTFIKLPNTVRVGRRGRDEVETYIAVSNGHGGFASFNCYPTSIRGVCSNTLSWSERDLGKGVRFHHTGDLDEKVKQARMIMGLAMKEADQFGAAVKALANTDLSKGQIRDFMELAFTTTFGKAPDKKADPDAFERWTEKRREHVEDWLERMENPRQTIPGIQGTAWAALNSYTEWSDHFRGGEWMKNRTQDHRAHSNLFGVAAAAKKKMLREALLLTK